MRWHPLGRRKQAAAPDPPIGAIVQLGPTVEGAEDDRAVVKYGIVHGTTWLQRAARVLEFSIAYSTIARVQWCANTNAANSVQLVMQSFGLILGRRRSASAIALTPVKTKGASQERTSAAQPEGRTTITRKTQCDLCCTA